MRLSSNHFQVIALCKHIANLDNMPAAQRWQEFHRTTLQLYVQLSRNPGILDAIATCAYATIHHEDITPAPLQLEWDALSDKHAQTISQVIRVLYVTPCDLFQIRDALDFNQINLPLSRVADAIERLTAAGMAFYNDSEKVELSPLGLTVAKDLDADREAIRPHHMARIRNRRRE